MSLNLDKSQWTRVKFGEVVFNVNTSVRDAEAAGIDRVIAMEHLDPGELRIQRWGNVADGTTFTRLVKPGQTLFGKRRAYQRKVAYAEFEAICSGDILTFQANEARMLPEFLPFLVQSDGFFAHALGTSAGSLSPRTNWTDLSDFEFDLPPLDEQKRLADLLWAVERHRSNIQMTLKRIDATQEALVNTWWIKKATYVSLSQLGACVTGATPRTDEPTYWDSPQIPFVTPGDFNSSVLTDFSRFISRIGADSVRQVPKNSVLVVCIGATLGKTARLEVPGVTNQQINAVIGLDEQDADQLVAILASNSGQQALWTGAGSTTIPQLNKSSFQRIMKLQGVGGE